MGAVKTSLPKGRHILTSDLKSEKELATVREGTRRKNVPAERTLIKVQEEKKKRVGGMVFSRNLKEFNLAGSLTDPCFEVNWGKAGQVIRGLSMLESAGYFVIWTFILREIENIE